MDPTSSPTKRIADEQEKIETETDLDLVAVYRTREQERHPDHDNATTAMDIESKTAEPLAFRDLVGDVSLEQELQFERVCAAHRWC